MGRAAIVAATTRQPDDLIHTVLGLETSCDETSA
jgi:hypothetical protein